MSGEGLVRNTTVPKHTLCILRDKTQLKSRRLHRNHEIWDTCFFNLKHNADSLEEAFGAPAKARAYVTQKTSAQKPQEHSFSLAAEALGIKISP